MDNRSLNESVTMTGYLKEDGRVGKVSRILEKAKVSKDNGFTLFLVPPGQKVQEDVLKEEVCTMFLFKEICRTVTNERIVDVEKEAGISVIEVSNIQEAMEYLII